MLLSSVLQVLEMVLVSIELLPLADEFSDVLERDLILIQHVIYVLNLLLVLIIYNERLVLIIKCICIMNLIIRLYLIPILISFNNMIIIVRS